MLLLQLQKQLEKSPVFLKFREENPDSFLCAGFFILNFKSNIYEYSLDYRTDKQIFTFKIQIAGEVVMLSEDIIDSQKPLEKIKLDVQIDINDLRAIVEKSLTNNNVKNHLEEVIAVLQVIGNQQIWNLTCMCEGMTIINMHIHPESGLVLKFEKKNLLDFVKR